MVISKKYILCLVKIFSKIMQNDRNAESSTILIEDHNERLILSGL